MRLLLWILLLVLIFAAMVFAVSNADSVTLRFWPFPSSWDAPLFAVVTAATAFGLAIGVFYGWLMGGPARRRARALARENGELAAELDHLRSERMRALRGPDDEDMD
jgi:uncharacterized integral membrane protein